MTDEQKKSIYGLELKDLKDHCTTLNLPSYLASQIFNWIYKKNALHPAMMKNISKKNQELLTEHFEFSLFKDVQTQTSKEENAIKHVGVLQDDNNIEFVVLKEKDYYTLCISSQCGCPVDCKFCLTGVVGFKRQLSAAEIVAQVVYATSTGYPIKNIVFMGMGEPLLNYEEVFKAIDILTSEPAYDISKRGITISTSGYAPGIKRLMKDERYVNLAFSVGAADPLTRIKLMPIENRHPITSFIKLVREYQTLHNRKLTLEYTLLEGVNDSDYHTRALMNLSQYLDAKINLINLNPHPLIPFKPLSEKSLLKIRDMIKKKGFPVTVRYKKGQDITAACGQLGLSHLADSKKAKECTNE